MGLGLARIGLKSIPKQLPRYAFIGTHQFLHNPLHSQIGCVAATENGGALSGQGLDLQQLTRKTVTECEYLEDGSLRYISLTHGAEIARGLHVYALHIPADSRYQDETFVAPVRGAWC